MYTYGPPLRGVKTNHGPTTSVIKHTPAQGRLRAGGQEITVSEVW
jgi:hypothetical protein